MGNITVSQVFLKHKAGEVYLHAHRHIFCTYWIAWFESSQSNRRQRARRRAGMCNIKLMLNSHFSNFLLNRTYRVHYLAHRVMHTCRNVHTGLVCHLFLTSDGFVLKHLKLKKAELNLLISAITDHLDKNIHPQNSADCSVECNLLIG